jgi:hypothetical protein
MAIKLPFLDYFKEAGKGVIGNTKGYASAISFGNDYKDNLNAYEEIYKTMPLVQAGINYTADLAVGTGYMLISEDEHAKEVVSEFLDNQEFSLLMHRVTRHVLVYGNAYLELVRLNDKLVELKLLHPKTIKVKVSKTGDIQGYEQAIGFNQKIEFTPEEIAHFKWNVIGDSIYGTSVIEAIRSVINVKAQMENDLRLISHRYAAPQIQYKLGSEMEPATAEQITEFNNQLDNQNPEMDLITSHAVEAHVIRPLGTNIGVEGFLSHIENQVIAGIQVPEVALGRGQSITEATAKVQIGIFDRRVKSIQRELSRQSERLIIQEIVTSKVLIEFGEFEKEDEDVKVNRLLRLKAAGVVTSQYVAHQLDIPKKYIPDEIKPINGGGDKALKGLDDSKKDVNPPKRPLSEGFYYVNTKGDIEGVGKD